MYLLLFQTLKYEEEFSLALESFNKASLYDPVWEPPKLKERQLIKYLNDICELVSTCGKMKAKRLQQILQVKKQPIGFRLFTFHLVVNRFQTVGPLRRRQLHLYDGADRKPERNTPPEAETRG